MRKLTQYWYLHLMLLITAIVAGSAVVNGSVLSEEDDHEFHLDRRVNVHGDEFMSLALTSDARRLVIGTEAGKLVVWGIPERRVLKELDQGSPVHCVTALNDPQTIVAAGGPHDKLAKRGVVRRWNVGARSRNGRNRKART